MLLFGFPPNTATGALPSTPTHPHAHPPTPTPTHTHTPSIHPEPPKPTPIAAETAAPPGSAPNLAGRDPHSRKTTTLVGQNRKESQRRSPGTRRTWPTHLPMARSPLPTTSSTTTDEPRCSPTSESVTCCQPPFPPHPHHPAPAHLHQPRTCLPMLLFQRCLPPWPRPARVGAGLFSMGRTSPPLTPPATCHLPASHCRTRAQAVVEQSLGRGKVEDAAPLLDAGDLLVLALLVLLASGPRFPSMLSLPPLPSANVPSTLSPTTATTTSVHL